MKTYIYNGLIVGLIYLIAFAMLMTGLIMITNHVINDVKNGSSNNFWSQEIQNP